MLLSFPLIVYSPTSAGSSIPCATTWISFKDFDCDGRTIMVSIFPTEIYEHIIDAVGHSWKPHRTLRSCALTCRAWLPRSRMNIFRSMSFASVGAEGIHKFSQILDNAPHLQLLVEEVKVSMSDHPLGARPQTREAIEILPIILWGKLPVLRALRLSAINRNTAPLALHRLFFPCLSQFSTITTLTLYHVTYSRFGDFAQMLRALRNLRNLECGQVRWLAWSYYQFPTMNIARLSLVEGYDVESNRVSAHQNHNLVHNVAGRSLNVEH